MARLPPVGALPCAQWLRCSRPLPNMASWVAVVAALDHSPFGFEEFCACNRACKAYSASDLGASAWGWGLPRLR